MPRDLVRLSRSIFRQYNLLIEISCILSMPFLKREAPDEDDEFDDIDDEDFLSEATALEAAAHLHAKRQKHGLGDDPRLLDLLQNKFGLQSFRLAQEAAITRSCSWLTLGWIEN